MHFAVARSDLRFLVSHGPAGAEIGEDGCGKIKQQAEFERGVADEFMFFLCFPLCALAALREISFP